MRLTELLPEGIREWLPPRLDVDKRPEVHATCSDCVMLGEGSGETLTFRPETKCCTYHPWLPNFLVGGLFADPDPALDEGRRRVRARIEAKERIAPVGVQPPPLDRHLYGIGKGVFGRASSLRCPYYDPEGELGNCTVWRYREAVCATWFCKYAEGADGLAFWQAVRDHLIEVEVAIVTHTLLELGFDGGQVRRWFAEVKKLGPDEIDHRPPSAQTHDQSWGAWSGREIELYLKTHEIAGGLDASAVEALLGVRGRATADTLERAAEELARDAAPDPLMLGRDLQWNFQESGGAVIASYNGYDPVSLSPVLVTPLRHFDGRRANAEVLALVEEEHGIRLTPGLLLALYRQRVLVDPSRPERSDDD